MQLAIIAVAPSAISVEAPARGAFASQPPAILSRRSSAARPSSWPTNVSAPKELKNAGLKATVPRLKIISIFESSKVRHLTA
jgi:hypothetical protein